MALSLSQTVALARLVKPGMRICGFGYPDVIAPQAWIDGMLGEKAGQLQYRADSEAICKRHGLVQHQIPDAESLFRLLDCELTVYDIVKERGCEVLCDLNLPMMSRETYDIVLDVGTVEHCFNIAQAVINMAGMVKLGGFIIHENPHSGWGNHGFYSLHPTFFHDFYTSNGFEIIECSLTTRTGESAHVPLTKRFNREHSVDANIFCVAKRLSIMDFVFPKQTKYL